MSNTGFGGWNSYTIKPRLDKGCPYGTSVKVLIRYKGIDFDSDYGIGYWDTERRCWRIPYICELGESDKLEWKYLEGL